MSYPLLTIAKGKEHSIQRKHPWVFSGALASDTTELQDGDLVCLTTKKQQILGIGHFQHATIAVRMLSFDYETIDVSFFERRLSNAYELRLNIGLLHENNNIFRICHGEGDQLPGLIIDFYNGVAVIQCHSYGMYRQVELISAALQKVIGSDLKAVYHKSSDTLPKREEVTDAYLIGEVDVPHIALENAVQYNIDWVSGQKTGFFIDQRENRALLGKYAKGKKVLNTFCYSGGFSLQALQHGAALVHSLDSSKKAIGLTDANISLNKFAGRHASIVDDAMDYMKNLAEDYDIIVLDPPAFAKHRDKRHQAIQGYKRLNAHAIRQIKPGGLIFTFSCSQVVDTQLFTNTVIAAAIEAGRSCRILEQLHQPADHPIQAFHPEGAYLKGLVIRID
ncbi:MAG: class I SAM-dependent rRNA methyltransferase [Sphingomonadales bacterium]